MRLKYYPVVLIVLLTLILSGCGNITVTPPKITLPATSPVTAPAATEPSRIPAPTQNTISPTASTAITPGLNASPASKLEVYYLDAGQGDSEILRVGSSTMLIDSGTNASTNTLISDIKSLGITNFDVVIGTHPHEDHIGGMDAVISQFGVGKIYMPKVSNTTKTFEDVLKAIQSKGLYITTPVPGSSFSLGPDTCTILAPNSASYEDLNNYSIVIRVVNGNSSFLFTGDAQTDSEKEMLAKGFTLKSDVLKVGHHGSNTATSPDFLKAVSPKYAVISCGLNNDYGHPHQVTLDKLNAAGVQVYRTDLNGIINIVSDGTNLNITANTTTIPPPVKVIAPISSPTPTLVSSTTPSLSPTLTPTPTPIPSTSPTLTLTPPPPSNLALEIVSVTSPIKAGSKATLAAKTTPGSQCTIKVYYKSGLSSAAGLTPKTADSSGGVSWTWTVGPSTTPGTWQIVVESNQDGKTATKTTTFTVQ